ncbi:DUF5018 domain-containing protein, partial [Aquimarina algiphila]
DPTTAIDYSNPVKFTVTAEDGTTKEYTITVTVLSAASTEKSITKFTTTEGIDGVIDESSKTIVVILPSGTSKTGLKATAVISDKASISPDPTTAIDYSTPVIYTVTAEDGTTQEYTVSCSFAKFTEADFVGEFIAQKAKLVSVIDGNTTIFYDDDYTLDDQTQNTNLSAELYFKEDNTGVYRIYRSGSITVSSFKWEVNKEGNNLILKGMDVGFKEDLPHSVNDLTFNNGELSFVYSFGTDLERKGTRTLTFVLKKKVESESK